MNKAKPNQALTSERFPAWTISVTIFTVSVVVMYWMRLVVYPQNVIALSYGLPLLLCLWHRDRRLLWAMVGAFLLMAAYKNAFLLPLPDDLATGRFAQWVMQAINLLVIGGTVHGILELTDRLRSRNADLEKANRDLAEREVEIKGQNEELHAQAEELAQQNEEIQQQNEEIQQQSEEVQQQAEELQTQAEQLRSAHEMLLRRENVLEAVLRSIQDDGDEHDLPNRICVPVIELFDGAAVGTAVVERDDDELIVLAEAGGVRSPGERFPYRNSVSAIVMENGRTAFIEDSRDRPDLAPPSTPQGPVLSVLATPLRIGGDVIGSVAAYSLTPRTWTETEFTIIEWAAAQCGLLLTARRLQRSLADSNLSLDRMVRERTAELQETVNELEHFSYTIAHDLRAPLRALQGYSELLAQSANSLDDDGRSYLRRIASASARMDHLITDALSYSRTVRGEMPLAPVDTEPLLCGIVDSYPALQSVRADIAIDGRLPCVLANEAGLTQCFSNILGNAVKFVRPGETPRIRIWAERNGKFARLNFQDNGIGIPEEAKHRIFEMFYRINRDFEGTGIGLALVRKVAERMGGRVGVESEAGAGSRFWLDLKLAR